MVIFRDLSPLQNLQYVDLVSRLKDLNLALAAAEAVAVPMPIASLIRDHFLTALARGYQELDWSALARIAAENAGLSQ
jgi:3-hydroxyisobutyrate dehydrogenase-like beta-hydroxyacid dehydrogenase